MHRQLTEASQEWLGLGREPGSLYRGVRLGTALEWAEQHEAELNDLEREFLESSREAEASELEESRRRNRRLRVLAGGLGVLVLAAAGLAVLAIRQTSRAEEQGRVALSRALAGQANAQLGRRLDQALLLALEAYRNEPTPEARSALLAAVQRTRGFGAIMGAQHELASSVTVSADGKTIASGGADGEVVIWSVARRRPVAPAVRVGSDVRSLAFSPEGEFLAVGTEAGAVALVDVASGGTEGSLEGHDGPVTSLVFDSRERLRSASGFDGRVLLWDVAGRRRAAADVRLAGNTTGPAAMAPDAETVAAPLQGGRLLFADARSGRVLAKPRNGPVNVEALAFSPDGRAVATGDGAGRVSVWDSGGRRQRPLGLHPRPVRAVAFSPDGRTVVSAGADGADPRLGRRDAASHPRATARPCRGRQRDRLRPRRGLRRHSRARRRRDPVADEGWARPRADACAVARLDLPQPQLGQPHGRARKGRRIRSAAAALGWSAARCAARGAPRRAWVSFSPNRPSVLAVADDGGAARLWDVRAHRLLRRPLSGFGRGFAQAALSPDGKTLAAAGYDGEMTLWNLRAPGSRPTVIPAHKGNPGRAGLQPRRREHRHGRRRPLPAALGRRAPSPARQAPEGPQWAGVERRLQPRRKMDRHRGRGRDGEALDARARRPLGGPFVQGGGGVTEVAFSPDSRTLGVADLNGLTFWAVPSRRSLGRKLQVEEGVGWGEFTQDGRAFVTLGQTVHQRLRPDALERRPWPAARSRLRAGQPRPDPSRMGAVPPWGGLSRDVRLGELDRLHHLLGNRHELREAFL